MGAENDGGTRRRSVAWRPALRGALAMAAALLLLSLARSVFGSIPYPPARIASLIVAITPGSLATAMIERLGHAALRGLGVVTNIGTVVFGGYAAVMIARAATPERKARMALAAGAFVFTLALVLAVTAPEGFSLFAIPAYLVAALAFARVASGTRLSLGSRAVLRQGETPLDAHRRSRRRFLFRSAALVGGIAAGGAITMRLMRRGSPAEVEIVRADSSFKPSADDPGFPIVAGLSPEITTNEDFYNVDINIVKPSIDRMKWNLRIHGSVERPYTLTYRSLQSDFEVVEMAHTLSCISNEVGGDLVSTAVWRGVRLKDVLDRAGLRSDVVDIAFRAAEGYSDSISLTKALEATTLVVFGMNGEALPKAHGFPARIIVPGIYGMKNVKWLTEIEAMDHDYKGYWEVRGWSDVARVKTESRIDTPPYGAQLPSPVKVAGVAWAGDRGVRKVEVSEDGGNTWREAMMKRELAPLAWRLWATDLSPGTGPRKVIVRATDGRGEVQTSTKTRPHPDGASGRHAVEVTLY